VQQHHGRTAPKEIPESGDAIGPMIQAEVKEAAEKLQGRKIEELADAPEAADPEPVAIIGLLSKMAPSAYIGSRLPRSWHGDGPPL
jgi:hypothetical protein